MEIRTWLAPRYRMKFGNPTGQTVNPESIGKILQLIGRSLKVTPPNDEEKGICDALFQAIGADRIPGYTVAETTEEVLEENTKEVSTENN